MSILKYIYLNHILAFRRISMYRPLMLGCSFWSLTKIKLCCLISDRFSTTITELENSCRLPLFGYYTISIFQLWAIIYEGKKEADHLFPFSKHRAPY